jgi:hypothetical protein
VYSEDIVHVITECSEIKKKSGVVVEKTGEVGERGKSKRFSEFEIVLNQNRLKVVK